MKKIFTICTVMLMSLTVLFAQGSRQNLAEKQVQKIPLRTVNNSVMKAKSGAKITGNPTWNDTMSYCGNDAFASAVGVGSTGTNVYWAIKIEAAALAGRNTITDVEFFVYAAGTYNLSIAYGSTSPGTAVLTQSATATTADSGSWKNVHLTTPLSITSNQDMWIIFMNNDVAYPAAGVTGNSYDNGKYISLDGSSWALVSTYGLDYTWMIRAISDTYTLQPPSVNINGPQVVLAGDTVTYTANGTADSYVWTLTGADYQSTNANTANVMWATAGTKQVVVAATNTAGTGYDTLDVNVIACTPITTLPWVEDFENASPCWQLIDNNNNDNNWTISATSGYAHSGTYTLNNRYSSTQEDNWAISPAITIPANATDISLSWYVAARSTNYPETYNVLISSNGTALTSFDSVFGETYGQATYTKRTVSLADYAGMTINIAFQYLSEDMFYLYIDDIRVGGPELPEGVAISGPTEIIAGNTATYIASTISENVTFAWTAENGTPATATGDTLNVSWAAAGNYNVILAATNTVGTVYDTLNVQVIECNTVTTLPYVFNFDSVQTLQCWTTIDANNDGLTWSILPGYGAANYSYDNANYEAIEPDDYLVSPAITLPANGNYELFFQVYGLDENYVEENYTVYVATENHSAADFVNAVYTETISEGGVLEHSVNLNNYAGQTIYIAFRHHDCEDMFALIVKSVEIRGMQAPSVTISAPSAAIAGNTVTLTAVGDNIDSYSWTIEGATPATATTQSVDVVWNNAGTYNISVTVTNAAGSNTATATVNVISCDPITNFPYTVDFENGVYSCFTFIDADGDGQGWETDFNFGENAGHDGSTGLITSASYINNYGPLTPDNWFYLPAITVPAEGGLNISWWEKGQDADYAEEHYAVYVNNQPTTEATTIVYEGDATGDWVKRTANLGSYAGQTIYINFRHYNVTDMYMLDIDDIVVNTGNVNINEANSTKVSIYPNPTNGMLFVEGEGINSIEVMDINGRTVKSSAKAGAIDLSDLENGVYMVRTATENGVSVKKIVKK